MPPEPDGAITNQIRRLRFNQGELTQQALAERGQMLPFEPPHFGGGATPQSF